MIRTENLTRTYQGVKVLDGVNLEIEKGSFTVILGRNGSGKSTLAKHLNALLVPQSGSVTADGMDTSDLRLVFDIRARVGMVFQNPESQQVALIVEDDTAFAPENLGLDENETMSRVEYALAACGISKLRYRALNTLSGGQKQLAAIAGVLAMKPDYIVFDESTSMLDPRSRGRVMDCVMKLRRELNTAVVWITHYMEEAVCADRVIVMDNGMIKADGTPDEIFSDAELIESAGLEMPPAARLCLKLRKAGIDIPILLTPEAAARKIAELAGGGV